MASASGGESGGGIILRHSCHKESLCGLTIGDEVTLV